MGNHAGALPAFTVEGVLPPGDYPLTLVDLAASPLVAGFPGAVSSWDSA